MPMLDVFAMIFSTLVAFPHQEAPPPAKPSEPAPAPEAKPEDPLPRKARAPPVILRREDFVSMDATANAGIADDDPILGVTIGNESRAYPVATIGTHEVVNDQLAGVAIAITW